MYILKHYNSLTFTIHIYFSIEKTHMWSLMCSSFDDKYILKAICPRAARVFIESPGPGDKSHLSVLYWKKIVLRFGHLSDLLVSARLAYFWGFLSKLRFVKSFSAKLFNDKVAIYYIIW